jgi:hypothetical protein
MAQELSAGGWTLALSAIDNQPLYTHTHAVRVRQEIEPAFILATPCILLWCDPSSSMIPTRIDLDDIRDL